MAPAQQLLKAAAILILVALSQPGLAKRETKTYTVNTADGPVTVTETKVTETSSSPSESSSSSEVVETSGWSSSTKELLKDSKVSDMSVEDLGGSLVLAIDKTTISKGLKKYIMDAMKKLPVNRKGIKIGLVEYTDRPYTVVSLKHGWSLDRIMAKLQQELSKSRSAKRGLKIYDYVGIQAAYNELQKFGKSSGPRIVMLLSSGKDANKAKTEQWRHKLMKEWISLSEIVVDSSSGSFSVLEGNKEASTDKTLEESTFLTSLLKSYSHSTIQYYKKIYGEVWEFYIVLKHYQKLYPHSWKTHLKAWFTSKYGGSTKFETYLHKTESETGGPVSPEDTMKAKFKSKYGSDWEKHFLIWKYKKLYGLKWKNHYEQHLMKKKYGKNWFSEWEKLRFKKKYGKKWEPHYVKWYFKKYRGATWIYSWMKWQFKQKHKEGSKAYVLDFMRWYFKYTKKGDKAFQAWKSATQKLSKAASEQKFRWFYYNLVFQKKQALVKYTKWYYRKKFGKKYLSKYKAWLHKFNANKQWIKIYRQMVKRLAYTTSTASKGIQSISWFKKRYGASWRWYYTRVVYRRRYGRKWRVHFRKWLKTVWKKPSPKRSTLRKVLWFRRRPGHHWHYHVKRTTHRGKIHSVDWFKKRYGSNWRWFYTRRLYQNRYGSKWRLYFKRWVAKIWRRPAPAGRSVSHASTVSWRTRRTRYVSHPVAWFRKRYGSHWKWYYTRNRYRIRYGNKWRLHLTPYMKSLERKAKLASRLG